MIKTAIIVSKKDIAGINIKNNLIELYDFEETEESYDNEPVYEYKKIKLYTVEKESIYNEDIDKNVYPEAELILFATKHQSVSGVHSLSVHVQGNWGKADFGGKNRNVCVAPASLLKFALLKLEELNNLGFDVIQECTHHGPYLEKPTMFIEIGSDEEAWERKDAGHIIANTIMFILKNPLPKYNAAMGIGGLHHTPNFKRVMLETDYAFGHICPKYNLESLDKEMIQQAIERTLEKVELVVLDWKGLGGEKERIKEILDKMGIKYKKTKELTKSNSE